MKKIIMLLCLGLIGCATVGKESKTLPQITKKPVLISEKETVNKKDIVPEKEMDDIIAVFSEAINKTPSYAGGYYNRAIAYFYYQNNYDKCWRDVHKAESLGCKFSDDFINSLKKASNREK